ncbi:MAG TPA: serine protease [Polyangiaceae bacterium]
MLLMGVGCSGSTAVGDARHSGTLESGGFDEPHLSNASAAVERRMAMLLERTAGIRVRQAPTSRNQLAKTQFGSASPRSTNAETSQRRLERSRERDETLKVRGASGEICAAVSITSRLAVTALHCAKNLCESMASLNAPDLNDCAVRYEIPNGTTGQAKVVATSENDLLALLELSEPLPKHGALRCDDPRADDRVYTVSHPNGAKWQLSYGRLTRGPIPLEWTEGEPTRVLVAEIATNHGSSGGGLFDVEDQLVGVQIARWSRWTTDYGKAAFIQATRIFTLAGRYCMRKGSSACVGLSCASKTYDVWNFD